ncbi:MAG: pentapeptide repeat-containing protein [Caldilineaceae bacterium]|nr:pentapeptide repeat-containing protein [Caldilineaceae bacterium]
MNEERLKILAMLQDGKITVDEAARLLEATEAEPQERHATVAFVQPVVAQAPAAEWAVTAEVDPCAGAFLAGARLDGALLDGAQLAGAFLLGADLRNADLRGADLRGAFLAFADLYQANLQRANLNGAFLLFANGSEGNLAGLNLAGSFMPFTRLHSRSMRATQPTPAPMQPLKPANE